ncbi:MAG: HAD-IIIC family phosphatase, partial [Atribacterota bacterium]|nr:HAD-IIIC family phosphatase [Atribacterota bacterium]
GDKADKDQALADSLGLYATFQALRELPNIPSENEKVRAGVEGNFEFDYSRPLPNKIMPTREEINKEIKKYNLNTFEIIHSGKEELREAIKYLMSVENVSFLASELESLAAAGLIRVGPLEGFLATAYFENVTTKYILLSNLYPEYNTILQRAASLIHEIGAFWNRPHIQNDLMMLGFINDDPSVSILYDVIALKSKTVNQNVEIFLDQSERKKNFVSEVERLIKDRVTIDSDFVTHEIVSCSDVGTGGPRWSSNTYLYPDGSFSQESPLDRYIKSVQEFISYGFQKIPDFDKISAQKLICIIIKSTKWSRVVHIGEIESSRDYDPPFMTYYWEYDIFSVSCPSLPNNETLSSSIKEYLFFGRSSKNDCVTSDCNVVSRALAWMHSLGENDIAEYLEYLIKSSRINTDIIVLTWELFRSARQHQLETNLLLLVYKNIIEYCDNEDTIKKALKLEIACIGKEKIINEDKSDTFVVRVSCRDWSPIDKLYENGYIEVRRELVEQDMSDYPDYIYVTYDVIFLDKNGQNVYAAEPLFGREFCIPSTGFGKYLPKLTRLDFSILVKRLYKLCIENNRIEILNPILVSHVRLITEDKCWKIFLATFSKFRKCLIIDCDGVLWDGVLNEDSIGKIKVSQNNLSLQEILRDLKKKGFILAINSRNNYPDVIQAFSKIPGMIIKADDFVVIAANWEDKDKNIRSISQDLNIGLDDIIFIDDSQHNRGLIKVVLPQVLTLDLNEDSLTVLKHWSSFYSYNQLTEEDAKRTDFYRTKNIRDHEATNYTKREDFYSSLNMEVIMREGEENLAFMNRLIQITQRTNQFNLTTQRLSEFDIQGFIRNENYKVFSLEYADKFGKQGIISLMVLYRIANDSWQIDIFALSCRIIGLRLEDLFINFVANKLKSQGFRYLRGVYIPSSKN